MKLFEESKIELIEFENDVIVTSTTSASAGQDNVECEVGEEDLDLCLTVPELD